MLKWSFLKKHIKIVLMAEDYCLGFVLFLRPGVLVLVKV